MLHVWSQKRPHEALSVINTKEPEFFNLVKDIQDKIIIDFVRLDESLLSKSNYSGINW